MRMRQIWAQNGPFAPTFFWKKLISFSSLPSGSFHYAKFKKKFLQQIQSYEGVPFFPK